MMTGEFRAALDEKGRLLIPTKLRVEIAGDTVILTKGIDRCLWLFSAAKWEVFSKTVQESVGMFAQRDLMIQRRIIGSAMELDVDKAGRIGVSALLREHAGLTEVFKPRVRPWIDPLAAPTQAIKDQVAQCPSGALSIKSDQEKV